MRAPANDAAKQRLPRIQQRDLAAHRFDLQLAAERLQKPVRPGAGRNDEPITMNYFASRIDSFDATARYDHRAHAGGLVDRHAIRTQAGSTQSAQVPRIPQLRHARNVDGVAQAVSERWFELCPILFGKWLGFDAVAVPFVIVGVVNLADEFQAAATQVTIVDAGAFVDFRGKLGEEPAADRTEPIERQPGMVKIARRQDAGAGPGRFHARLPLLAEDNAHAVPRQEVRGRQADDAAAYNDDIAVPVHTVVISAIASVRNGTHEDDLMAGLKLLTNLEPQLCLKLAWRTAQDAGYSVTRIEEGSKRFTATKGNMLFAALAGALAPRCSFEIAVEGYPDATELLLYKNTPWLTTGVGGVATVARQADELMQGIAGAIEKAGGTVSARKEF